MFTWLIQLFGALYKAFNVPLVQPSCPSSPAPSSSSSSKEASPGEGSQGRLGGHDEGPLICLVNRELNQTLVHLLISHSLRPLLPNSVEQFGIAQYSDCSRVECTPTTVVYTLHCSCAVLLGFGHFVCYI